MRTKVFIRTDGSARIGLGHLFRCIALGHMLKTEFDVVFVCKEIPVDIITQIEAAGFQYFNIENEDEFEKLFSKRDIIVLDGYNFDTTYQKFIKERCYKLICIDDIHEQEFVADLIINHAPGVSGKEYKALPSTQFALGLDYALLRPSFLSQARNPRKIDSVDTVLICFGGADDINLTKRLVESVSELNYFKKILVLTGTAYRHLPLLQDIILADSRIEHHHGVDEKEILEMMLRADLAIVPASGILLEVLAVGCIAVSGYYVKNQLNIYNGYRRLNAIVDAGDFTTVDIKRVLENVDMTPKERLIDGKSGERLISKIRSLEYVSSDFS